MNLHVVRTRFVPGSKSGPKPDDKLTDRIPEIRRLLRTDLPMYEIAVQLRVCTETLRRFIKRRQICDLTERSQFIRRYKAKAPARSA